MEIVKILPQEFVQNRTVEQIVDVSIHQFQEETSEEGVPEQVVEQIVDVPVSQEARGIYDPSFPSFMKRVVDICKDMYTSVVRSPSEVVDPRNSAEESPVSMQCTAPHAQHQASTATGHSSFEISCSFTKQVAQHVLLRSWKETTPYKNDVYLSPNRSC